MSPRLIKAEHVRDYCLELIFDDGLKSIVDFKPRLAGRGGIWSPLHDVEYFKQARIDSDLQTIVWPNGADICPDVLYSLGSGQCIADAHTDERAAV